MEQAMCKQSITSSLGVGSIGPFNLVLLGSKAAASQDDCSSHHVNIPAYGKGDD